jgi:two-component system, cell cycle response regulator DivK
MARILIIEDDAMSMKHAILLLQDVGHRALCAVDGEAGVTLARTGKPDLILMDIQLPGMDGLEATALLKKNPATAAIPIVAVTAMVMRDDREKATLAGCDGYIAKPYRSAEFYSVINSFLLKRGPQATIEDPGR